MHWHRLGERCGCGHLSVPARFYKDATQKQAEAAYLEFLKEHMPELWAKLTGKTTVPSRPITSKFKTGAEVRNHLEKKSRWGGKRAGAGRPRQA